MIILPGGSEGTRNLENNENFNLVSIRSYDEFIGKTIK